MIEELIIREQLETLFVAIDGDGAYSFNVASNVGKDAIEIELGVIVT